MSLLATVCPVLAAARWRNLCPPQLTYLHVGLCSMEMSQMSGRQPCPTLVRGQQDTGVSRCWCEARQLSKHSPSSLRHHLFKMTCWSKKRRWPDECRGTQRGSECRVHSRYLLNPFSIWLACKWLEGSGPMVRRQYDWLPLHIESPPSSVETFRCLRWHRGLAEDSKKKKNDFLCVKLIEHCFTDCKLRVQLWKQRKWLLFSLALALKEKQMRAN